MRVLVDREPRDASKSVGQLPSLSNLDVLEAQACHILLEARATLDPLALMFSGGKDSACIAHLLGKLLPQGSLPRFIHYDSGDNFDEVLAFRDQVVSSLGAELTVYNVVDASSKGLVEAPLDGEGNVLALVELISYSQRELGLQGLIGGGRRDEDPVRAKERVFSVRDAHGKWNPSAQRPELWNTYNTELADGEHLRIFPISNWTERTVWEYIASQDVPLPSLYYAHEREVFSRSGQLLAYFPDTKLLPGEAPITRRVRCRTIGDRKTTGFIESNATDSHEVLAEILASNYSERAGRGEDSRAATSMEARKKDGWF